MRLLIKHALSHSNIRFATPLWKSGRKTRSENTLASKCLDKMSRAKLSLSLYKANLSLLRHSSSCILCGISNSFIQIHIANSCTCFSCASLLRTMRYNAAGAELHCAPDRTLGYAILFSLPFSPKHIGALRVHELRFICKDRRRYSRKRAKFYRNVAKNWQLRLLAADWTVFLAGWLAC